LFAFVIRVAGEENKFNSSMVEFHKELVKIDEFLSESLKEILVRVLGLSFCRKGPV